MTSLGFPGLSSQSISGFCGYFWPEKPETDWDEKPGLPRVVIPVRAFLFFCRPENPETDWDDKLGLPRVVIPVRFWVFGPFRPENPKQTGMTNLGFPGFSSQSVSGFWPFSATKPQNGLG